MRTLTSVSHHSKMFFFTWIKLKIRNYPFEAPYCEFYRRNLSSINKVLPPKLSNEDEVESSDINKERQDMKEWLEMWRLRGKYAPEDISEEKFQMLLCAKSVQQRKNILSHHGRRLKYAELDVIHKEVLKQKREERHLSQAHSHIKYGLWENSMFCKVRKQAIANLYSYRLVSAIIHGQPLIIDLDFEEYMNLVEKKMLSREILSSINLNLKTRYPFNLLICNAGPHDTVLQKVDKFLPKGFPMLFSPKSYLDLFTKEKLVYLTKDATDEMDKFDSQAIYIIGGLVDHGRKHPVTCEKAQKEGIKVQKFPLASLPDSPLKIDITLNIPDVVKILLELSKTGSWKNALKNLPEWQVRRANRHREWKPRLGIDEGLILLDSIR